MDSERFGAVPRRFSDALVRGEIGCNEWALGAYLICAADWQTHEISRTLRGLADEVGWEKSPDTLARVLRRLRKGGWIDFDAPRAGQRRPYVVRLTGLLRADLRTTSANDPPPLRRSPPQRGGADAPESTEPSDFEGLCDLRTTEAPRRDKTRPEETISIEVPVATEEKDRDDASLLLDDVLAADWDRALEVVYSVAGHVDVTELDPEERARVSAALANEKEAA